MGGRLMLFVDAALSQRFEAVEAQGNAGFVTALQRLQPELGTQALAIGGGIAVALGAAFPVNRTFALGSRGPVTANELDAVEALYADFGLPAEIEITPFTDPSLVMLLRER